VKYTQLILCCRYGFIREVKGKYKHNSEKLLRLIDYVYRWLPLGTLINNKVLVVHGGISDITDLEWIKTIDRHKVRISETISVGLTVL
jgi:serine/threonine-protein phosphatase with EF-hand domain